MKALVYRGNHQRTLDDVPAPTLQHPADAIVRITHTTICGTDLHILKGDLPEVTPGRILGHEGVGVVTDTGPAVLGFQRGDRVIISCITACGRCEACRRGMNSHCASGGWILGHTINGTQAESVRIPYADTSLYLAPPAVDSESLVMLSDVLPTAYECGIVSGDLGPGQTVAIIGAGPIGLAALLTARLLSPAQIILVDTDDNRLEVARDWGATMVIDNTNGKAAEEILEHTGGRGVDLAIEAVGIPSTFQLCQNIVAAGGRIANVGVHGQPVALHLEKLWSRNITLTTRLVDTTTIGGLLKMLQARTLTPSRLITHRFDFNDILQAYDVFGHAAQENALKMLLTTQ